MKEYIEPNIEITHIEFSDIITDSTQYKDSINNPDNLMRKFSEPNENETYIFK